MKKFNKQFKIGTKVILDHDKKNWVEITEIHETRNWIKTNVWSGSFQRNHVLKFSNKK